MKTREEKINSLIETGFKYGNINDNSELIDWLGDEIGDADTVMYDFNDLCVSYTIGKGEHGIANSSTCGTDDWGNLDDEFIDYLISL